VSLRQLTSTLVDLILLASYCCPSAE